jgi:hypothetical protein
MLEEQTALPLSKGRFTLFLWRQVVDAIPVHDRWLKVLVREGDPHRVVLVNSSVVPITTTARAPLLSPQEARDAVLGDDVRLKVVESPELVFHTAGDEPARLSWRMHASNGDLVVPVGAEYFVDALDGSIVDRRDSIYTTDIEGSGRGYRTEPPLPDHGGNPPEDLPLPGARVRVVGAETTYVAPDGSFVLPHEDDAETAVVLDLIGLWADVGDAAGPDLSATVDVTPPGPADFLLNDPPGEYGTAQLNAIAGVTVIHDFIKSLAPALTALDYRMPVNVNLNSTCNAYYSSSNGSTNYYRAGGGCVNTAFESVIHHEYGHAVTDRVPGGPDAGDYHEGMSDALATLYADSHCLGPDFEGQDTGCLRDVDSPNVTYPCSGGVHACGRVIAGAFWDLRVGLGAVMGSAPALQLTRDFYMGQELTGNHQINPSVTVDVLTLDDDNGDIYDGTPHHSQIAAAFNAHGLTAPTLDELRITYPEGRPALVAPDVPFALSVHAQGVLGDPVDSSARLISRVEATPVATSAVDVLAAGSYEAHLPAAACRQRVYYGISVQSDNELTVVDPKGAPTRLYEAVAAIGTEVALERDFETSPGWTVSNSAGLTDGAWTRGVPVDAERGDPTTDYDGSGSCWLTDNAAGNSDVDGGTTTLTSEQMDLSGMADPWISYDRWYSNTFGDAPQADTFLAEVSNNDGASWSTLEIVGPTLASANPEVDGGWHVRSFRLGDVLAHTNQVRIRFVASDLGTGSVIEAAIDAIKVYDYMCPLPTSTPTPTVAPIQRGDCNADRTVNAGDVSGMVLEVFDGDGVAAVDAPGGSFAGHIVGCDANADLAVNAGDISCAVLLIFNGPGACGQS